MSDDVVDFLYSPSVVQKAGDIDFILGCGDLPYAYLEYLLTLLKAPLYYVHGNHDPEFIHLASGERSTGPGGALDLDGRVIEAHGLLLAGLQGSIRYKPEGSFQHTEFEMWRKVLRLAPRLWLNQLLKGRALDVLITHSPPLGIHNGADHVHRGFASFLWLLRQFRPQYHFHGHHHVYRNQEQTVTPYHQTIVTNVYPYKILEIDLSTNDS